jgi:hypothetical protein
MKDERQILADAVTEAERNLTQASRSVEAADWVWAGRCLLFAAAYCQEANRSARRLAAAEQEKARAKR